MKKVLHILILFFISTALYSQVEKPIGINLTPVYDYSTEYVFTDAFKQARRWIAFNADGTGGWENPISVPLNENGYPLEIPYDNGVDAPQAVRTLLVWENYGSNFAPQGQYRLKASGTGTIRLRGGASGTYQTPVDILVDVSGGVMLEILESSASDSIHDINFVLPDYVDTYETQEFTDELLTFLEDFQLIRFMDWAETNFSTVSSWSDRNTKTNYSQSLDNGVAWEYAIDLCNLTGKDAWINVPHLADDNYIQELATLFRENLNPDLKIYLEYSNELWNTSFDQYWDVAERAEQLGYTGESWERAWKYTAKRSADVFFIFESVFTNDADRIVKIMPSQANVTDGWLSNQLMQYFQDPQYNPNQVTVDAIAIAPYFAGSIADAIVENGEVESIEVSEIVTRMSNSLAESYQYMIDNKQVADNYNLRLITYEGGQHLVGVGNNISIQTLTDKLIAANRHPEMQNMYCAYFNRWYEISGDLFTHFSSHRIASNYGSWGIKEHFDDTSNYKYQALINCVFSDNTLSTDDPQNEDTTTVFPNPSSNGNFTINHNLQGTLNIKVYDVNGREITTEITSSSENSFTIHVKQKGIFFIKIVTSSQKSVSKTIVRY